MSIYTFKASDNTYELSERSMYGSSRVGMENPNQLLGFRTLNQSVSQTAFYSSQNYTGDKNYELSNHLGNVLEVITDRKLPIESTITASVTDYYTADVISYSDYYPYGMVMPGRNGQAGSDGYRYGFNGMEADDELKGTKNSYDFGARLYDPRVGRWLTIDPQAGNQPSQSPYKAFLNNPIVYIDPNGETEYEVVQFYDESGNYLFKVVKIVSSNLISGGDYDDEDGANVSGGYDYKHVTQMTITDDGKVKLLAARETITLKSNGVKDKEYYFFAKKKGVIYNCDVTGDGGVQNGGFKLVTKSGGADPTKQRSLNSAEERDIEDLLAAAGGRKGTLTKSKTFTPGLDFTKMVKKAVEIDKMDENGGSTSSDEIPGNNKTMSNKVYPNPNGGEGATERWPANPIEKMNGDTLEGKPDIKMPNPKGKNIGD